MTEAEWRDSTDPHTMLEAVRQAGAFSERQWRLFGVACCRRILRLMEDAGSRDAVAVAERCAVGAATAEELGAAFERAFDIGQAWKERAEREGSGPDPRGYAALVAADVAHPDEAADDVAHCTAAAAGPRAERAAQASFLRCIVGNPFRPAILEPSWRTPTVVAIAAGIDEERAFDRLPVLADALEDAGCVDAAVLDHCRGPGPHVRGCWVVDRLLRGG